MRLIDADDLIKDLEESHKAHSDNSREESLFRRDLRIIMEQPTAYDVGKVVAELEEKMDDASMRSGSYEDYDEYEQGKANAFEYAIDIVKAGGV